MIIMIKRPSNPHLQSSVFRTTSSHSPHPPTNTRTPLQSKRTLLRRRRRLRTEQRLQIQSNKSDHRLRQPGSLPIRRGTANRAAKVGHARARRRRGRGSGAERLALAGEEGAGRAAGFGGVGGRGEDGGAQGGRVCAADGLLDVGAFEDQEGGHAGFARAG